MAETLLKRYRRLVAQKAITPDNAQEVAVEKLQLLANRLAHYTPPTRTDFLSFFTRRRGEVPKGLYMFGGVGRGKTMLMDLFYETVPVQKKQRAHFHEFMAGFHSRLAATRTHTKDDPVIEVASVIAEETQLLCLDELFVIDIADATILSRLFSTFFQKGMVIVTTSNAAPSQLYKDGRNRDLFLPFIDLIESHMEVLQLEAVQDYRMRHFSERDLYFVPPNKQAKLNIDDVWHRLTLGEPCVAEDINVLGHVLHVPCASMGAARFSFSELFEKPLGASDYLALARRYHTFFIDGIPIMDRDKRNEARRFITFVDAVYDHHRGLVATAEAEPDQLYDAGDGADHFERTASRLIEMRSESYITKNGAAR